jgi:hypothetical protein
MLGATPYASNGYTALKLEPHLHTLHSDGRDSVASMFAACKGAGYDAVALTDHNTLSGLGEATLAAAELGLILLPGVEVTTFHGHAVVLGVAAVPEWRDLETRGMDALATEVHDQGGVLSVAHPASLGSPVCSGCRWEWPIEPASSVDLWEVVSAARVGTDVPVELWRQMLQRGGRMAPVAAGDVHSVAAAGAARPATRAYARERSADGVLEALRARRTSLTRDVDLELWLEAADGRIALVGERVSGADWTPRVRPSNARLQTLMVTGAERCVYAEVRDDQGGLEAITAPIWISTSH